MKLHRISLVAVVLFSFFCSCSGDKKKDAELNNTSEEVQLVKVQKVIKQSIEQEKEFSGNIEPFVKNFISSPIALRIEKIHVDVGDNVTKGQVLVQMDQSNFQQAKLQLENLQLDFSRIKALYESGGASKQQYDQLKTQIDVSKQSIKNLEENTKLLSPISGIITMRNFDDGDVAGGQPILQVMQLQPVKIKVNISEEFYPKVKVGTTVEVSTDTYPGVSFSGKISLIYPTIDPATRTFIAQVTIANKDSKIRPGMFARAKVNFGVMDRLVISDKAVVKQQGTNDRYVFKLNGDKVSYVKVEIGARKDTVYEVLSGLELGDQIVVAGGTRLVDQAKVKVQN